jgi:hypothetical protein
MKAIRCLTDAEKKQVNILAKARAAEFLAENRLGYTRRVLKLVCIALNDNFGFGKYRLSELVEAVSQTSAESNDNPVFWANVDKRIEQIGLPFEPENYKELEE